MANESFPFSTDFLDSIESILFDNDQEDDCLDLFGIHGLVCSFLVAPETPERNQWLLFIIGDNSNLDEDQKATLEQAITQLQHHISEQLESEEEFTLPEETYDDDNALVNWCAGFVEGFLACEQAWFQDQDEANVAGLLLPIMAHSELFQDDDFEDIRRNDKLMAQMVSEIPENVVDLFLLYRSGN
ncbi:metal-binding protein containing [Hahella sp. CCB-MM4]|uniref:YecA/YgfB family protein n=1 Tax=Hahella sp. (strain CCB-MM4) TaxID=1926491 RepID=UPI000B9AF235|nr:YecA family protein [Hahella sp. CCB-MM4]OZG71308.1 metal-binding protein containing [Hahella sp. CCB-MM4]